MEVEVAVDGGMVRGRLFVPSEGPSRARVLLVPGFGATVDGLFLPIHHLLANGYEVLGIDSRHHPGRSDGAGDEFRLSRQVADVAAVLGDDPSIDVVIAFSIAFPPALRAVARHGWEGHAVLGVLPSISALHTLGRATGIPFPELVAAGQPLPPRFVVMGRELPAAVIEDGLAHGFGSVALMAEDARALQVELGFVASEKDDWVEMEELAALVSAAGTRGHLRVLDDVDHHAGRNIAQARSVSTAMVEVLGECSGWPGPVVSPSVRETIAARKQTVGAFG